MSEDADREVRELFLRHGVPSAILVEYHQHAFALLHEDLKRTGSDLEKPHAIRQRFWQLAPHRRYEPDEGRALVRQYMASVEGAMAEVISKQSLAYWLHLYRRLAPEPIGQDKQPMTVALVRAILEAAIQKYATLQPCSRVGLTGEVSIDRVLGGVLMAPEFDTERQYLSEVNQLVLTDFTTVELREFYDLERLAYEMWRSSAMLRIIGKGAPIMVEDSGALVSDLRSDELDRLVRSYDQREARQGHQLLSSTGVVQEWDVNRTDGGEMLLPVYNVTRIPMEEFSEFFGRFRIASWLPMPTNFIWQPFNLRQYRKAHLPFSRAFREHHGVELDAVLLVLAGLGERVLRMWLEMEQSAVVRCWQRGYEGPYERGLVLEEVRGFQPIAARVLGLDGHAMDDDQLAGAVRFWELHPAQRARIDLSYPGPHSIFLPYGNDRVFIDYAWAIRRLYDLFVGTTIPDQNFKGDALEEAVRRGGSVLPVRACKSNDGQRKQVDAAFEVGSRLVIVECRAVGRSIGFARGSPAAMQYRNRLLDKALADVDAKARWLAARPVGVNYDISQFSDVLPIAVTPFVEYIRSTASTYWVTERLPRIMTPDELRTALEDGSLAAPTPNAVLVSKPPQPNS